MEYCSYCNSELKVSDNNLDLLQSNFFIILQKNGSYQLRYVCDKCKKYYLTMRAI